MGVGLRGCGLGLKTWKLGHWVVRLMLRAFAACRADIRGQAPIHEEWDSSGFDVSGGVFVA